jgi:hypothetical protein
MALPLATSSAGALFCVIGEISATPDSVI